jgi:hypothetical protein
LKITKQQIAEYINARTDDGDTNIAVYEVQRDFSVSYAQAREILDSSPNLLWNPCCGRYSILTVGAL